MARPDFTIPNDLQPKDYKKFLSDFIEILRGYEKVEDRAEYYATMMHKFRRYEYGGGEYTIHLKMVVEIALKHLEYFPKAVHQMIIAACWLHDIIEDCGETYNDVKDLCQKDVANICMAVTNVPDINRDLRAMLTYPKIIKEGVLAIFVKCCDRYANTKFSKDSGSGMYKKYKSEYPSFRKTFMKYDSRNPIWKDLDKINEYEDDRDRR